MLFFFVYVILLKNRNEVRRVLPVVGVIGGLGNPVYYRRILSYVQLKYQKRYLLEKERSDSG